MIPRLGFGCRRGRRHGVAPHLFVFGPHANRHTVCMTKKDNHDARHSRRTCVLFRAMLGQLRAQLSRALPECRRSHEVRYARMPDRGYDYRRL